MNTETAVASVISKPFYRHIGKCKGCKKVFSVKARYLDKSFSMKGLFPGYDHRKTQTSNFMDCVFECADGTLIAGSLNGMTPVVECDCALNKFGTGFLVPMNIVQSVLKPGHVCNAQCTNSKGHVCECSCGGQNHGAHFNLN